MSDPETSDPGRRSRLDRAMAEYLVAADAGRPPDRGEFLARYPDLRDDLATFLDDRANLERLVEPLRGDPTSPGSTQVGPLAATRRDDDPDGMTGEWAPQSVESTQGDPAEGDRSAPTEGARVRYFGDYELVHELGRGGMGVVYQARQVSLNRPVALKMIRDASFASDDDRRRFQNEAEAVATLDHPGIVPIYEVGEHDGLRYFSMKLILGGSLAEGLAAYRDDPRAAASLLARVAEAVHHAHMRGILHRDLKPANILVDAEGHPHVTDFGLAKKVGGDSELTASGAILGTPAYMAPEQAGGRRGAITTATDVYGLGSVLYALLAGKAPFAGGSVADTLMRVKDQAPDPPRKHNARLPRDLEVICLKCLEKDPRRRYAGARDLAEDLRRWLAGEPIAARPVGSAEQAWLWCRRRPALAGLAASLAAALLIGLVGITWGWLEARRQRNHAEENFRLALRTVDDYLTRVSESRVLRVPGLEPLRRELLEDALRYYRDFVRLRARDPSVRDELMRAYERVGQINDLVGTSGAAMDAYRQSLDLAESRAVARPGDPTIRAQIARVRGKMGVIQMKTGQTDLAFRSIRRAISIHEELVRDYPSEPAYLVELAGQQHNLGIMLEEAGRPAEGLEPLERARATFDRLAREQPGNHSYRSELAHTERGVGNVLSDLGRTSEAMDHYRRSRETMEGLVAAHPDDADYGDNLAAVCNEIGMLLGQGGRTEQAVEAYRRARGLREALARAHPAVTGYRRGLAHTLHQLGLAYVHGDRPAEAVEPLRASRELYETLVRDHPENLDYRSSLGGTLNDLGLALADQGRHPQALDAFRAAIDQQRVAHERAPRAATYTKFLANHFEGLAGSEMALGRASAAIDASRRVRQLREELVRDHPDVEQYRLEQARSEQWIADSLLSLRRPAEAIEASRRACTILEALARDRPDDPERRSQLGAALNSLGMAMGSVGRPEEAMAAYARAIEHQRIAHERDPVAPQYARFLANHHFNRGLIQKQLGLVPEARESFRANLELVEATARAHPAVAAYRSELVRRRHNVGTIELGFGDPAAALGHFERAREAQEALQRSRPDDPDVLSELGGILNDRGMALAALSRHQEAIESCRAAIGHQRSALDRAPGSRRFRKFLGNHYWNLSHSLRELGRPAEAAAAAREGLGPRSDDPGGLYDLACELSLCVPPADPAERDRYAGWAIDALRRAVAAGFRDFAHMRVDKDLDPLRSRDDFRALMMDFAFPADPIAPGR